MIEKLDFRSTKLQVVTKTVLHMLLDLTSMDLPVESCFLGVPRNSFGLAAPFLYLSRDQQQQQQQQLATTFTASFIS